MAGNMFDPVIFDIEGTVFDGEFQSTPNKRRGPRNDYGMTRLPGGAQNYKSQRQTYK